MGGQINFINPDGLFKSPAFSQVVTTSGAGRTIYVGGQDAADQEGKLVGKGDLAAQTTQAMKNVETALKAAGVDFSKVIKMGVYLVQGQDIQQAYKAAQPFLASLKNQPTVSMFVVAGLTNPDYLIEVDAVAFD